MNKNLRQVFFIMGLVIIGCMGCQRQRIDTRITLWHLDKIPYGTKYAYDNLAFVFPNADIRTSHHYPNLYEDNDTSRALIAISPQFLPDPDLMNSIVRFAANGNQVFISAFEIGDSVLSLLHLSYEYQEHGDGKNTDMSMRNPNNREWLRFRYPGFSRQSYFTSFDTGYTAILGKDASNRPNFVRLSYDNGGAIFIHLNPIAFSNYFLLHKENKLYYDLALSNLSSRTSVVEWSDYFRYSHNDENFSALRFILSNQALKWAFWISIFLFLTMFLVDSKRKQRSINVKPPVKNLSEDFVKTVGRLYFQQKNNQNLALKMVAAFLENIRTKYSLSTSILDDEFNRKLAFRTGKSLEQVKTVMDQVHYVKLNPGLSDEELMSLHLQIAYFNKLA